VDVLELPPIDDQIAFIEGELCTYIGKHFMMNVQAKKWLVSTVSLTSGRLVPQNVHVRSRNNTRPPLTQPMNMPSKTTKKRATMKKM
jgi:hypothetical protein